MKINKNRVFLLYHDYLKFDEGDLSVGGVQTYITNLVRVINNMDLEPVVIQRSYKNFDIESMGVRIIGVKAKENKSTRYINKIIFNKCLELCDRDNDIIIFCSHSMVVKNTLKNSIAIQHGIAFDSREIEMKDGFLESIKKLLKGFNAIKNIKRVKKVVSVDYNFLNWYRTMPFYEDGLVYPIPNFVNIDNDFAFDSYKLNLNKESQYPIKVVFSRRFIQHRGTNLMIHVIKELEEEFQNKVEFSLYGEGPEENYVKKSLAMHKNVHISRYPSETSLEIHKQYDIAIVPTVASEGTSLSLLEAMASKCAIITTNVGGLSNIAIDEFNALVINPNPDELLNSLKRLILDRELRLELGQRAHMTAVQGFNFQLWEKKWSKVLKSFLR